MTPIRLTRIDPAKNMARFYALELQPTLFGPVAVVRSWGRIGQPGRIRSDFFDDQDDARAALQRQAERKKRRGYIE